MYLCGTALQPRVSPQPVPFQFFNLEPVRMSLEQNGYLVIENAIDLAHIDQVERELQEVDIMRLIAETMAKPNADIQYMTELPWTQSCTNVLTDFWKTVRLLKWSFWTLANFPDHAIRESVRQY
jgi:hypothetical protein